MKPRTYLLFIFLSFQICLSQEYIYQHFGVDEGLSSSEVFDIYQDKLGYVWFATDKGLSRYNGYEFENFTTKDGLPGNTILDFYPQKNGQIWCYEYHSKSLFYFNEIFDGFKVYKYNKTLNKQLTSEVILKSIVLDDSDNLHFGGYALPGLIKISKDGQLTLEYNLNSVSNLPYNEAGINLGYDKSKDVFFSVYHDYKSNNDIQVLDLNEVISSRLDLKILNKKHAIFIDQKLGITYPNGSVQYQNTKENPIGIKPIDENLFFVGYYSNGAEIRTVSGEIIDSFLPNNSVSNFLIDNEGGYWFTTLDDGVIYIKNPEMKVFTKNHINSLVKDNKSKLYTGHHNGDISRITHLKTDLLYKGLNDRPAHVEFSTKLSEIYGSSDFKIQNFTNKQPPIIVNGLRKLSEHFWAPLICVSANGYKIKANDSIVHHKVGIRTEDVCNYKDTTLIGTPDGLYFKKNETILKHHISPMLKSRIYDIDINKNTNSVYIASQGYGVIVYGDSIYNISKDDGLTNTIVSEIHIENNSTIWACTNTGLNRINFNSDKTYSVNTITKSDGLLSNDINDIEIINDTVWVATKKGLCFFRKNILSKKETSNIISLSLKGVSVNNKMINNKSAKLKYHQNNIEFKLLAISHKNTDNIHYSYRLKEVDSTWTVTKNRNISFPSLSPGNYTFEAKANVFNNPNNFITSYSFKILPPFWKSWWFYSICFLLFSILIYLFFRVRVLTYNQDVFRELIRLAIKRLKRKELFYKFRANGEDFKIPTHDILYINSQGNYLDIITKRKTYTIRCKIGDFINSTPDELEYLRIHRSYIIRIDQVSSKGKKWVVIQEQKIPVGETYLNELNKIQF